MFTINKKTPKNIIKNFRLEKVMLHFGQSEAKTGEDFKLCEKRE